MDIGLAGNSPDSLEVMVHKNHVGHIGQRLYGADTLRNHYGAEVAESFELVTTALVGRTALHAENERRKIGPFVIRENDLLRKYATILPRNRGVVVPYVLALEIFRGACNLAALEHEHRGYLENHFLIEVLLGESISDIGFNGLSLKRKHLGSRVSVYLADILLHLVVRITSDEQNHHCGKRQAHLS